MWNGWNRRWTEIFRIKFSSHSVDMLTPKLSYLGFLESSSNWRESIASRKSYCLVRSLARRCDWTVLLRKRWWYDCQRQFGALWSFDNQYFCLVLKNTTWRTCGFNETVALLQETFPGSVISRRLVTKIMRFDTIRLFVGLCERPYLCR